MVDKKGKKEGKKKKKNKKICTTSTVQARQNLEEIIEEPFYRNKQLWNLSCRICDSLFEAFGSVWVSTCILVPFSI